MKKDKYKNNAIEIPKETLKKHNIKEGDWLVVRMLNGKEIVLEKPKSDYWDETFIWGKKFSKKNRINKKDIINTIRDIRSSK
ncbi:AbrB/MazE/SpoVT family DNA-binding domain-containing protein [Candidatus Margulisiibacteriota bacterium]